MAEHIAAIMNYTETKRVPIKASDETVGAYKPDAVPDAVVNVKLRQYAAHSQSQLITLTEDAAEELIAQLVKALRNKQKGS